MRPLTPRKALINQRRMNVLHKPVSPPLPDDPELAPDRPTCVRCGWDVRAGTVLCRVCEAAHATAKRTRASGFRVPLFWVEIDLSHGNPVRLACGARPTPPDDDIPF
jgi:hypothetical protein